MPKCPVIVSAITCPHVPFPLSLDDTSDMSIRLRANEEGFARFGGQPSPYRKIGRANSHVFQRLFPPTFQVK